jgi:hypothetical protein
MDKNKNGRIVLYTNKDGKVELRADIKKDTLWATQDQMARLFETERSVVTKHINNIFNDDEVDKNSYVQKMHITQAHRPPTLYSLDIILAVGHRTNSKKAIEFRKWATCILRQYLIKGFNLDRQKLIISKESLEDLHTAIDFIESKSDKPLKAKIRLSLSKDLI